VSPIAQANLDAWCARWLGSTPEAVLFEAEHLSAVVGLRLADGREVVVKARPRARRIDTCVEVQRRLWTAGFPASEPLAGPAPLGALTATAEVYVAGGAPLRRTAGDIERSASALARLVRAAPEITAIGSLEPAPPWVGWDHGGKCTWPWPDDRDVDLNDPPGAAWLEDLGRRARERLAASDLPLVVGHADWEAQNLRWVDGCLHVVHDWDSIAARSEAALAGAASAVFTVIAGPLDAATVEESAAFLDAYETARGRAWSDEERQVAWAAGLWLRAFDARKAALDEPEGAVSARLQGEADERLRCAAA
jgi:hypothetical protein